VLYNQFVTRAKTIRVATSVGLGLAVFGDLACRSTDKIEKTEPASVPRVTAIEPATGVEPIRIEGVDPSAVDPHQIVIEDDVRKLCEVIEVSKGKYRLDENGQWKPVLINGDMPLPNIIIDIEWFKDNFPWSPFEKRGARFSPDFVHDRTWEDERQGLLFAPPPGK